MGGLVFIAILVFIVICISAYGAAQGRAEANARLESEAQSKLRAAQAELDTAKKQAARIIDLAQEKAAADAGVIRKEAESFKVVVMSLVQDATPTLQRYQKMVLTIEDILYRKTMQEVTESAPKTAKRIEKRHVDRTRKYLGRALDAEQKIDLLFDCYPWLKDRLEAWTDDDEPDAINSEIIAATSSDDSVRYWLSEEEYNALTPAQRNQTALDRYWKSKKTKREIGWLFELYVGLGFMRDGFDVTFHGEQEGLEDLGIDLIARKDRQLWVVQCKYWSSIKLIRENAIAQTFGASFFYSRREKVPESVKVIPCVISKTQLSEVATEFAERLGVSIDCSERWKMPIEGFPLIRCNVSQTGEKIYHLPFDQAYRKVKIEPHKGEFIAATIAEAESAGFRRAWKWRGKS